MCEWEKEREWMREENTAPKCNTCEYSSRSPTVPNWWAIPRVVCIGKKSLFNYTNSLFLFSFSKKFSSNFFSCLQLFRPKTNLKKKLKNMGKGKKLNKGCKFGENLFVFLSFELLLYCFSFYFPPFSFLLLNSSNFWVADEHSWFCTTLYFS